MIRTVLGEIKSENVGTTLPHEHICNVSEYAYHIMRDAYLDKTALAAHAIKYLKAMKESYGLNTFVDCTPINLGRDAELLKRISAGSEVNIVCSTGFYFNYEPLLFKTSADLMAKYLTSDIKTASAGVIKCAVEQEHADEYQRKLLCACAKAHLETGLPIVMHTNAMRKNAEEGLEILLSWDVDSKCITVGHLSDTEDVDYVCKIASYGCYIGLDRLYNDTSDEYIEKKIFIIEELCRKGYGDRILLSHDEQFFNGFDKVPKIKEQPRFTYCFDHILPQLSADAYRNITSKNPSSSLSLS